MMTSKIDVTMLSHRVLPHWSCPYFIYERILNIKAIAYAIIVTPISSPPEPVEP